MDSQKVDMYILTNGKYFESHQIPQIRDRLIQMNDDQWMSLQAAILKDPQTALIISILGFVAVSGLDRLYIGDIGLGIAKLLTCGGFGIWTIVDLFQIQGATRQKNFEKIQPFLY